MNVDRRLELRFERLEKVRRGAGKIAKAIILALALARRGAPCDKKRGCETARAAPASA